MSEKTELHRKIDELGDILSMFQEEIKALKSKAESPQAVTYDDVVRELKPRHYFGCEGFIREEISSYNYFYATKEIAEREALRCKWLNIAEYVNRRHEKEGICFFCVWYHRDDKEIGVLQYNRTQNENTRFNSEAAAKEALQIMGEDNYKKMIGV